MLYFGLGSIRTDIIYVLDGFKKAQYVALQILQPVRLEHGMQHATCRIKSPVAVRCWSSYYYTLLLGGAQTEAPRHRNFETK